MKRIILLGVMVLAVAAGRCYAEPRESMETMRSASQMGDTMVVEHTTAMTELRTDGIQKNHIATQELQNDQYKNKVGHHTVEYNTASTESQVSSVQKQHQQSQTLKNRQMKIQGARAKMTAPKLGSATLSAAKFSKPKFSSNTQTTMTLPKFKTRSFSANTISVNTGQTERQVQSTNSAMSNMQVRYMNRVLEGRIDYAVNQGGRR